MSPYNSKVGSPRQSKPSGDLKILEEGFGKKVDRITRQNQDLSEDKTGKTVSHRYCEETFDAEKETIKTQVAKVKSDSIEEN